MMNRQSIAHNILYSVKNIALLTAVSLAAAPGCLDNSLHLTQSSGDYKNWHAVSCNCPCEQRYQLSTNGVCQQCFHRKDFTPLTRLSEREAFKATINIKKLKSMIVQK